MKADFVITIPAGPDFDPRLRQTLKSLRCQSPCVKVAFCDASNDARAHALAAEYQDIIDYVRHGPDAGQSAAINEGWRALDGRFYGWLNVDDYLAPNALSLALDAFNTNSEPDIVYGQSLMLRNGTFTGLHHEVQPPSDYLYRSNIISQPSCFVSKKALFDVGLVKEDLHFTMDWDLWARLMERAASFHYAEDIFSVVALSQDTKTSQFGEARFSEIKTFLAQYNDPATARKSVAAMRLDNAAEYGGLSSILKRIIRLVPNRKMSRKSFEGSLGQNRSILSLPLFHYDSDPKTQLIIHFENRKPRKIHIENQTPILTSDKVVDISLYLSSAETMILCIKAEEQMAIDLRMIILR